MDLKLFKNIKIYLKIECSTSAAASLTNVDRNYLTYSYAETQALWITWHILRWDTGAGNYLTYSYAETQALWRLNKQYIL